MAFYLRFEHKGEDLYPRLQALAASGKAPDWNLVRYEMLKRLGYFATESSEHFAEYTPWFIKPGRADLLQKYNIPLDEYPGRCQLYEKAWPYIERELEHPGSQDTDAMMAELTQAKIQVMPRSLEGTSHAIRDLREIKRSVEFAGGIIHSVSTGTPRLIHGNVQNHHLIDNLPQDCTVEVPCLVDHNGVQAVRVGKLPVHLAALMRTNVNVQELVVEAVLEKKREHVFHAAMLDPHTSAVLDLDQTDAMVRELLQAHRDFLPEYLHA